VARGAPSLGTEELVSAGTGAPMKALHRYDPEPCFAMSPKRAVRAELAWLVDAVVRLPSRERKIRVQQTSGFALAEIVERHGCSVRRASALLTCARARLGHERAA
jgi:DNA-directed RNA polymerase specialized sigma24 family protein